MSEQLDSLRQAAMTLLTTAPPGAVLIAVRALLDGLELDRPLGQPATAAAAGRLRATPSTRSRQQLLRRRPTNSPSGSACVSRYERSGKPVASLCGRWPANLAWRHRRWRARCKNGDHRPCGCSSS